MAVPRRRWLTALGLFLATAVGGLVAYLLARRKRLRKQPSLDEVSVADLSARLQREAATQERRVRHRAVRSRGRGFWKGRRPPQTPPAQPDSDQDDAESVAVPEAHEPSAAIDAVRNSQNDDSATGARNVPAVSS